MIPWNVEEQKGVDVAGPSQLHETSSNSINTSCMGILTNTKVFLDILQLIGRCSCCSSSTQINITVKSLDFKSKQDSIAQKVVVSCSNVMVVVGIIQRT